MWCGLTREAAATAASIAAAAADCPSNLQQRQLSAAVAGFVDIVLLPFICRDSAWSISFRRPVIVGLTGHACTYVATSTQCTYTLLGQKVTKEIE